MVVYLIVPDSFNYNPNVGLPPGGGLFGQTVWLSLLGLGAAVTFSRSGEVLRLLRMVNPYLLAFIALVAISLLWSIDPDVTLRRLIRILTIFLDAVAFAVLSPRQTSFQTVLRWLITVVMIGSIIFVIMEPTLAIEPGDAFAVKGAWRGLAQQKNGLGGLAAIGVILWFHAWLNKDSGRIAALIGILVAATCLIKSRSSTSIMAVAFAGTLMLMLLRSPPGLRRYLPYLIGVFVSLFLVYSLAVLNLVPGSSIILSPITMLTGKDQTFSGRTNIWAILNNHIALSPVVGSGYGAYWVEEPNSPSMEMLTRLYFYPTEGHNGYLDIVNDLGVIGALCLLFYLVRYLRQGLRLFVTARPQGALYLTLLFEQLIANLCESKWFNVLTCDFALMTFATVTMAGALMDRQARPQSAAAARVPHSAPRFAARRR